MAGATRRRCRRRIAGRTALALLVVGAPACTSGDDDDERRSKPVDASEQPAAPEDEAVVRGYAEALAEGRYEDANDLRCPSVRTPPDELHLMEDNVRRLEEAIGSIEIVDLSVSEVRRVQAPPDVAEQALLDSTVEVDGDEHRSLRFLLATEDARRCLYDSTLAGSERFLDAIGRGTADLGPTAATLEALAPREPLAGHVVYIDEGSSEVEPGEGPPGMVETWSISWRRDKGEYGGASVYCLRFESADAAADYAHTLLGDLAGDTVAMFDGVPGRGDVIGRRTTMFVAVLVQPAGVGPMWDTVVLRFGDVVVEVHATALDPGEGHDVVQHLARAVLDDAG